MGGEIDAKTKKGVFFSIIVRGGGGARRRARRKRTAHPPPPLRAQAGLLFGAGWWLFIDAYNVGVNVLKDPQSIATASVAWLPPFAASVLFLMVNGMLWSELSSDTPATAAKARLFLLLALLVDFAGITGAGFVLVQQFQQKPGSYAYAGASCLASTLMITVATFIQRFGSLPEAGGYGY